MSSGAPVCQLPNQSQATPSMPTKFLLPIPQAQDLNSAIHAVNALVRNINYLNGPRQAFVESGRVTQRVKVINPQDGTSFVIVERINSITFKDPITGASFTWKR